MITIRDVAYTGIDIDASPRILVDDLRRVPEPGRILHESSSGRSLFVDPSRIAEVFSRLPLDLYLGRSLAESPITPILMRGQMSAHEAMSAQAVLALAEYQNIGYVIVESDDRSPVGLVGVAYVKANLGDAGVVYAKGLQFRVQEALDVGLPAALSLLDGYFAPSEYHSESFRFTPPPSPWCAADSGGHWVPKCPCPEHRSASCRIP